MMDATGPSQGREMAAKDPLGKDMAAHDPLRRILVGGAALLAWLASLALLAAPGGRNVLPAVTVAALLASAPLLLPASARGRKAVAAVAVLLGVFVVLAAASVGLFYLPSAAALWLAAWRYPP
jgi:hypothetical protein